MPDKHDQDFIPQHFRSIRHLDDPTRSVALYEPETQEQRDIRALARTALLLILLVITGVIVTFFYDAYLHQNDTVPQYQEKR